MKHTILTACCAALCLASCGTYKKYHRPDVEMERLFGTELVPADTNSMAALPWRTLFTDSRLQALIDTGLANNADLRVAALRVKEAEATLKAVRLAYLPAFSLTPQGSLSRFGSGETAQTYSLALSADWEIELFGRLTNEKRGALASARMNRAAAQAVRTQLIATIANSYYNLLRLDAQLDISCRSLESWAETQRTLEVRKQVGDATEAAVSQAKADRLSVESSVWTLRQQVREQENALSLLIGTVPHPIDRSFLSEQSFPEEASVGVPLLLLEHRPDVRQAEYALQSAFYAARAARAAFYPQLTLSGTLGWTNSDGSTIANPGKWLSNAVGSLTQPLFRRGQLAANLTIAEAQWEEALVTFRQKLLQAGAEVNDALAAWQTARKRLDIDCEQVRSLQEAVRSTRLLMQHSDGASYLEVLTAQQALLQAELAEVQDRFAKIQGIIQLYHALGGGID